jgi:hypothetical protein
LARDAFSRVFGGPPDDVSCGAPADGAVSCNGLYSRAVTTASIRYVVAGGRLYWSYTVSAGQSAKERRGRVAIRLGRTRRVPLIASGSAASR